MQVPEPCTKVHCLAFMYLTFAACSDGELTDDERSTMATKLQEWCDVMNEPRDVNEFVSESIDWFNSCADNNERLGCMDTIARSWESEGFTEAHRGAIRDDLISIAKSDGNYDDVEKAWIELLTKAMSEGAS